MSKLIKRLEAAGKIRRQRAGFVQMEALLKEAILDLEKEKQTKWAIQAALTACVSSLLDKRR